MSTVSTLRRTTWDGRVWEDPLPGTESDTGSVVCGNFNSLSPFAIFVRDTDGDSLGDLHDLFPPCANCGPMGMIGYSFLLAGYATLMFVRNRRRL